MPPPSLADPGRIVAHRGASAVAPENTLAALRAAAAAGSAWVEVDISLLGDGTPVLSHDPTLDRCTDGTGPLSALGIGDLAEIDAGRWFGEAFIGEPLPRLEVALAEMAALGLYANLEMKPVEAGAEAMAHATARALAGPMAGRALVSSFDHGSLAALRRLDATVPLALLYRELAPDWREAAAAIGASAIHMNHKHLHDGIAAEMEAAGLDLRIYTLNDPARGRALLHPGLTSIVTDDPALWLADPFWAAWNAQARDAATSRQR